MARNALITGITGQDGAYLAKFLLERGYEVHGAYRRSASVDHWRLRELGIADEVRLLPLDLLEMSNVIRVIEKVDPDEVYNLAAQSFVAVSFETPVYTGDVDGLGTARMLEAIRVVNPHTRFYQASTSEMFGRTPHAPQSEDTPFAPRSPYGIAKLYAHWMTVNYREGFGLHASSGILFNHESPLRGLEFVTRKITAGLARILHERQGGVELGNLNARRDWGFAGDYVQGMWMMVQQNEPGDYVLATGKSHSVREFVEVAASTVDVQVEWRGQGEEERGIDRKTGRTIVRVDPALYRPADVDYLVGDPRRARARLGWSSKVNFTELANMMMHADMQRAQAGLL